MNNKIYRLSSYSAAAVSLLAANNSDAQIIYTDVDPDVLLMDTSRDGVYEEYFLDMNDDANPDFRIVQQYSYGSVMRGAEMYLLGSNSVFAEEYFPGAYMVGLVNEGEEIGSSLNFQHTFYAGTFPLEVAVIAFNNSPYWGDNSFGFWAGGQEDKYFAVKLNDGGDSFYGWVRMSVEEEIKSLTIKSFAYNSVAGEPINAGAQSTAVENEMPENIQIINTNNSIQIHFLTDVENVELKLYNINGAVVYQTHSSGPVEIATDDFARGIYIIRFMIDGKPFSVKISI